MLIGRTTDKKNFENRIKCKIKSLQIQNWNDSMAHKMEFSLSPLFAAKVNFLQIPKEIRPTAYAHGNVVLLMVFIYNDVMTALQELEH